MIKYAHVQDWVNLRASMCQPDNIYWCDGSEEERQKKADTDSNIFPAVFESPADGIQPLAIAPEKEENQTNQG